MGEVIVIDFLYARFCRDISTWYNKYYFGKDLELRKQNHLSVMTEKYEECSFSEDPETRDKEAEEFLTTIQRNVDGYI